MTPVTTIPKAPGANAGAAACTKKCIEGGAQPLDRVALDRDDVEAAWRWRREATQEVPRCEHQPLLLDRRGNVVGAANVSLMARGETQRIRFRMLPALSLVPDPRAPPNGCWPTTAPVGLSLM